MKTFSRLSISSPSPGYHSQWGTRLWEYYKPSLLPKPASAQYPERRRGWWQGLGPREACLSPPFPGITRNSLPELLLFLPDLTPSQLSFVLGVGADLTHSWGPGSSIRAPTLQGPPCHMVTALLRDQDKVLLFAPAFSHGTCTGRFRHHPGKHDATP